MSVRVVAESLLVEVVVTVIVEFEELEELDELEELEELDELDELDELEELEELDELEDELEEVSVMLSLQAVSARASSMQVMIRNNFFIVFSPLIGFLFQSFFNLPSIKHFPLVF